MLLRILQVKSPRNTHLENTQTLEQQETQTETTMAAAAADNNVNNNFLVHHHHHHHQPPPLQSGQYLGEISALCFLHVPPHFSPLPYLLVGTGSEMLLYDLEEGNAMKSFHVFDGIRVHGICCCCYSIDDCSNESMSSICSFRVAVYGERRVKLFNLKIKMASVPRCESKVEVFLDLSCSLPKFGHWVLDLCFLKGNVASHQEKNCLVIGCSDNSVCIWDYRTSTVTVDVKSPERCLLYSMRLWGNELNNLHVASGTIYNEIIVWKVVPQDFASSMTSMVQDQCNENSSICKKNIGDIYDQQYEALFICRLSGHEGSIFRIAWSSNGRTLVSVSDDRCARIWEIYAENDKSNYTASEKLVGPILFGHTARVWDCCVVDSLIVTAGEDCTCRVWGLNGEQLKQIKEHIGRGIWRCLYDPDTSLLITAGFDSSIKVHRLYDNLINSADDNPKGIKDFIDEPEIFTFCLPNLKEHIGLMDSKSEYVRCLQLKSENTLYVATNNGYLYHANVSDARNVNWTKIVRLNEEVPIVCMDLLPGCQSKHSSNVDDWVAVGDGKGDVTVVVIADEFYSPKVGLTIRWSAEPERQLLGVHWCKSLGNSRYIFTTDPRGTLKLWSFCDVPQTLKSNYTEGFNISLVAEFNSGLGIRVICLDASFEEEVLVCGDLRGNLVLFPLLKGSLSDTTQTSTVKINPINYFKGAHGISSISSIAVGRVSTNQIEICSTGADGCICYLTYDKVRKALEFIGMKQVKELSLVQSVSTDANYIDDLASGTGTYAIGFASSNFIIWNLLTETKAVQIACGGWRRPHSYCLGDVPEMKNCFAFVKDEIIYIHRRWVSESQEKMFQHNLRMQFHGREIHSICFISEDVSCNPNTKNGFLPKAWIATGCEDGTVRLNRYNSDNSGWSASKLLGEHVGGSAVRSICSVSTIHKVGMDSSGIQNGSEHIFTASKDKENPILLISAGAKRVLTCWLLRRNTNKSQDPYSIESPKETRQTSKQMDGMSFQWLSTDMPNKYSGFRKHAKKSKREAAITNNVADLKLDTTSGPPCSKNRESLESCIADDYENDWRYMAITAFLCTGSNSRITVCFVVVACSDATVALRALVLPYRLWFDVALLTPVSSPVLVLQHVVSPMSFEGEIQQKELYIVIGGSTDGSITFWDLTESVEAFMVWVSTFHVEKSIDCEKRPLTGRGSQGGRSWKITKCSAHKKIPATINNGDQVNDQQNPDSHETNSEDFHKNANTAALDSEVHTDDFSYQVHEIIAFHVIKDAHQSGVNCLHASSVKYSEGLSYTVISGGDDQAIYCLRFDFTLMLRSKIFQNDAPELVNPSTELHSSSNFDLNNASQHYKIRFLPCDRITSAHSSAVKGVWTDGIWAFSTGLDQRVRCWRIEEIGKLTEHAHLVISVPEPETLNAKALQRNRYQIAVAGRGMQMLHFDTPIDTEARD